MKKMLNILIVLVLMISVSSLALAEDAEDDMGVLVESEPVLGENETVEPDANESGTPGGNESELPDGNESEVPDGNESETPYSNETEVDDETEEEIEIMNNSLGAEIRLLQLEKAILKNIVKGERAIEVLKGLGYNTTELESIIEELKLVLSEVQAADPSANDSVKVFVDLKHDARKLTKEFRDALREMVKGQKYKEIKERIQQMVKEQNQSLTKQIRNRIKQFNRNQLHRLYGIIGEPVNNSILEKYQNGNYSLEEAKGQVSKMVNKMMKHKKENIFSELKKQKIKNQINATETYENTTESFNIREQERLQNRLNKAEEKSNQQLMEKIQEKINESKDKGNQSNAGSAKANKGGNGRGNSK